MQYIGTTNSNIWASSYCTCSGADGCFGCPGGREYSEWLRSSAGRGAASAARERKSQPAQKRDFKDSAAERGQQKRDIKAHNKERRRKAQEAARLRQQERSRVYTHADYVYEHSDNFDELADAERRDKAAAEAALRNAAAKQKKAAQAYEKMLARPGLSGIASITISDLICCTECRAPKPSLTHRNHRASSLL